MYVLKGLRQWIYNRIQIPDVSYNPMTWLEAGERQQATLYSKYYCNIKVKLDDQGRIKAYKVSNWVFLYFSKNRIVSATFNYANLPFVLKY